MLISPELFLDCILLIVNDGRTETVELVKSLIALFESDVNTIHSVDQEVTKFYIRIIKAIMLNGTTKESPDELRLILLKFKSDKTLEKRTDIYQLLHDTFMSKDKLSETKTNRIIQHIKNTLIWHKSNKHSRTIFAALSRCADLVNPDEQTIELIGIQNHVKEFDQVFSSGLNGNTNKRIDRIDFSNKESITQGIKKHKQRTVTGIIKVGLRGLAEMLGHHKGYARGESVVFNALSHNFKSGLLVSSAIWAVMYNIPSGSKGKPLIYFVSVENEAFQNMIWAFRQQYYQITGGAPDHMTDDEVCNWIYEFFNKNGITFIIDRYQPSEFGYEDLVQNIEEFEAAGYEVYMCVIDYMNNMKKGGGRDLVGNHLQVKELYSNCCNYTKNKGITLVTAHQLNREAAKIVSIGTSNVVKRFNSDHLADSMDPQREVDVCIFIHLEKGHNGRKYLTMNLTKHRYVDDTPEIRKYCAYPFTPLGIVDDIHTEPLYTRDIYADEIIHPDAGAKIIEPDLY